MQVAEDLGMKVERRPIPEEELETFEEAGACGTAAVISPISYIDDLDTGKRYSFGDKPGPQTSSRNATGNARYSPPSRTSTMPPGGRWKRAWKPVFAGIARKDGSDEKTGVVLPLKRISDFF